jgi:UDP-glucose 4-epimerase
MTSERFLVTGGAGFIGANLVRFLLSAGIRARVLDDFSTGRWDFLREVDGEVEVQEGDVRDLRTLRRAAQGMRAICHLAAASAGQPGCDENRMLDVNVRGTLQALITARELRIPVVFASHAQVYGGRSACLLHERMPPEPATALGAQKLLGEHYCRLFHELHGTRTVALRLFSAFGPFEDGASLRASVVAKFAHAITSGRAPVVFGDGGQTRDLSYVDNVCAAFLLAARAVDVGGEVFNVGSGEGTPILHLLHSLSDLAGSPVRPVRAPARPGDVRHLRAALGHATARLRYATRVRLREGLERTLLWHQSQKHNQRRNDWFAPADGREVTLSPPEEVVELADADEIQIEDEDEVPIYPDVVQEAGA